MRLLAILALALAVSSPAQAVEIGKVHFNQTEIEEKSASVDVSDPMAIFEAVFDQLADQVTVYPTENYFYFNFFANGTKFSGNLRLHPDDREKGLVHFAFFDTSDSSDIHHIELTQDNGVTLNKVTSLVYRMSFKERVVTFRLNPIAQDDPGAPTVGAGEIFVGRGFDESGLTFALVYNPTANVFIWVLDPDQSMPVPMAPVGAGVDVHVLSGFAFHRRAPEGRQVLLGVDHYNVVRNTWFDGPFDQLPDNWLHETQFQALAERAYPGLQGQINARGEYSDMEARLAVMPYMQYRNLTELVTRMQGCDVPGYQLPEAQVLACLHRQ